ncbi:hypothetical protein FB45DRAFT_947177 [Roridomyces roridus]|uniref:Uncharacterized protein n=1 Tax=Roridomyces roridus TaxID=1738132 RepID=A0AAD7B290_9AGAR|nr:hypothetical protein FB45DRAFT_947177 [Roridomyces roridus]
MLLLPVLALFLSSSTQVVHAIPQTLYIPVPGGSADPIGPSATILEVVANYTISAVGVGPSSMTTYVEKGVQTVVEVVGSSTFANPPASVEPTAYTMTFEENDSGGRFPDDFETKTSTCSFKDGGAVCHGEGATTTEGLLPFYTLGQPALVAAPTQTVNSAVPFVKISWVMGWVPLLCLVAML